MRIDQLGIRGLARRRVLKAMGGCAFLLAACGSGPRDVHSDDDEMANGARLLVLSTSEAATLGAFARTILGGSAVPYTETRVLQRLDEELYFVDAAVRADFHAALVFLDWYPLWHFKWRRFAHLDASERATLLDAMTTSDMATSRAVANSLRFVVLFFHYAHPATWPMTTYDGPFSHLPPQMSEQRLRYLELTKART